ncbi:hypothetical protein HPB47_001714 [Ixodes persulcatus]|uniref:Uncharacterized protein n=1 Tax=Ixodes persulcatus TaxID=34615 RepID=A0AC60PQ27_IXOPE|nr:hypothetical protein HPB47_001714 [Ixodes persulcatus]
MITRFGHFNPDKRTGRTMDGEWTSGEGGSTTTLVSEHQSEFNFEEGRQRIKILELEMELERVRSANRRAEGGRPADTGERGEQDDLRHFSKALSGVIQKFPSEAEVTVWFEAVETIFVTYRVPRTIWGQHRRLLSPNTGIARLGERRVALDPGYVPRRAYPYRIPEMLDSAKLVAIEGLLVPTTKRELRSALWLCGYYRDCIANYAEIAKPLTELTGGKVPNRLPWTDAADRAFAALRKVLCGGVALYTPDSERPYCLYTDASAIVVEACLAQLGEGGKGNPVAFASYRFTPTHMWWSIERGAFGVSWSLKKFDVWLFGASVTVVSDHNPLTYLTLSVPHGA